MGCEVQDQRQTTAIGIEGTTEDLCASRHLDDKGNKKTEYKMGGQQERRKKSQSKSKWRGRDTSRVHLWEVRDNRTSGGRALVSSVPVALVMPKWV